MAEKTFDVCTECGEETEVTVVDEETRLCEDCLNELDYIECDECHEFWLWDAIKFYNLKNGNTLCEHCAEMLLEDEELSEEDIESVSDWT